MDQCLKFKNHCSLLLSQQHHIKESISLFTKEKLYKNVKNFIITYLLYIKLYAVRKKCSVLWRCCSGREIWTQTSGRVLRSGWKGVNHYTGEGHLFTYNLGWELRLHPSHTSPLRREGSTARIGRSERGLRRERRKGLAEGGRAWRRRCCKWNRRSEGCVVQKLKLRRIITCSSCVFNHVGMSPHVTVL